MAPTPPTVHLWSSRPQMSYFPPEIKWRAKKGHHDRKCPIFHAISLGYKVHVSVSAHGRHEMITRAVVCPPLS